MSKRINAKVIVAGPAATGKTCLIERFVNNVFAADDATHGPTLGCDCLQKAVFVENTEVHLFLYDTAGQERFADMAASYYRVGEVCLLCFDMSDVSTFDRTQFWKKKVSDHNPKCLFILVGTKEDLLSEEQKSSLDPISRWAEEEGIPYFPTSALKGGEHIRFLFHVVAEKCIRLKREKQLSDSAGLKLQSSIGQPKAGCCP